MNERWLVVNTPSRREAAARDAIERLGLETLALLSLVETRHLRKSRRKKRLLSVFPGYLFVKSGPEHVADIVGLPEVTRILSGAEGPKFVPESVISELRARIPETGLIELQAPLQAQESAIKRGFEYAIRTGALTGLVALVDKVQGQRVRARVNGLSVVLPTSSLRP